MSEKNDNTPLVSVVMTVYNAERFLKETISSVLSQTYSNIEFIIVNDGSTDCTADIIHSFTDNRIKYISLPVNSHICVARNEGFRHSKGEFIAIADGDDIWLPEKLKKQISYLQNNRNCGVCFTWANIIDENGDIANDKAEWFFDTFSQQNRGRGEWLMRLLSQGNCFCNPSSVFRRDAFKEIGMLNESLVQLQDFDYWVRLLKRFDVFVIPEYLTHYRRLLKENTSISANTETNRIRTHNEDVSIICRFFDGLSDETFIELFGRYFRNSASRSQDELACEKAFLLKQAYCGQEPYYRVLQELVSKESSAKVLKDTFGISPKDFYKTNTVRRYITYDYEEARRILQSDKDKLEESLLSERKAMIEMEEKYSRIQVSLQREVNEKERTISDLRNINAKKESEYDGLREKYNDLETTFAETKEKLTAAEENVRRIENMLGVVSAEKKETAEKLKAADEERKRTESLLNLEKETSMQLECKNAEMNKELYRIYSSRAWKTAEAVRKFMRFLVPVNSGRALFFLLLWNCIRHPFTIVRNLKKENVKMFFKFLKDRNIEEIIFRIKKHVSPQLFRNSGCSQTSEPRITTPLYAEVFETALTIDDYEHITVPHFDNPTVSIIIPVYNQFNYTYHCVESIISKSGNISYEIIIADDRSSDITAELEEIITGAVHIKNTENLRFLRNCNNAAKAAKGEYVLFLNNDTQVCDNWLEPLITLIESSADIGMVGSKLIYPDGRLQEAGGILWKDGSAWNYGNGQNPELPEFNYVKQVDYISGASIMLAKTLWDEIGGFDDTFAPAYCEDSDLAFTIREMGYKVMYQPKSVVIHFEGKSNGTDTSEGLKHYQVVNQTKFLNKWGKELDRHPENGCDVFHARDCAYGKKTVLFVDHYVPTFDQDAGSRTVFQYLKLFVDKGYNVKFIGDNFNRNEPYTSILQQMGIEVLYGLEYANGWKEWIKGNASCFDYAFLNRPHIAPPYLEYLRRNTSAKLVYYGHDLAFLRLARESIITGDEELKASSEEWKKREIDIMRIADMSYYPSEVEVEEIHKIDSSIRVKAIPAYIFDDNKADKEYRIDNRKDIMFIGGFNHRPNVDAAKWLAKDIMPRIKASNPEIKVHIIGSHVPDEIMEYADNNFVIEGFVTDERLREFYDTCRISLVPLRYGAGIKGKVIEAMYHGIPVITTSVGAEGISGAESCFCVIDDAESIARKIVEIYDNEECLADMSSKEQQYVRDFYSSSNAASAISPEFNM